MAIRELRTSKKLGRRTRRRPNHNRFAVKRLPARGSRASLAGREILLGEGRDLLRGALDRAVAVATEESARNRAFRVNFGEALASRIEEFGNDDHLGAARDGTGEIAHCLAALVVADETVLDGQAFTLGKDSIFV